MKKSRQARGVSLGTLVVLMVSWTLLAALPAAQAGKVILRIRAGNPIEKSQKVSIRASLPARVTTNDIINLAGLDLGYDVDSGTYYVHKEVELGPAEIAIYDVELQDIWVIPPEELAAYRQRARELTDKLKGTPYFETAEALRREIEKNIDEIVTLQEANSIKAGARPVDHIRAYEANLATLAQVKKDLGRIENLVLGSNQDPGPLIGAPSTPVPRQTVQLKPEEYKMAVYKITARNTSPNETRKVPIRVDLPAEIEAQDILDSGGLDIGKDAKTGNLYAYRDNLELGPGQSQEFQIKIRDKWNIHAPRIANLKTNATDLLNKVRHMRRFPSVEAILQEQLAELAKIESEQGPVGLNDKYVAFYREQGQRLDAIEDKIYRVQSVLHPAEKVRKWGFITKAPTMKTTWLIIYSILGFLALITLLFSLRWLGKTKAEKMEEKTGAPQP